MNYLNETRINPEANEDSIPVIGGTNYYIDEQGFVSTYNIAEMTVVDGSGKDINVRSVKPVTEFIYIINNYLSFRTSGGFLVTGIQATKEIYKGGLQGIVGFNETETEYQFINNNTTAQSTASYLARINDSKQLEIRIGSNWVVPLGEFRCFINNVFYNINYNTPLPNSFGDTFTVTLAGFTTANVTSSTDYIRDIIIAGNTLYLSTRLHLIGSTPYDWSSIDTQTQTVVWSEDSRLVGGYFYIDPTATYFYLVNYNTSSIYYINSEDLSILQEYQHKFPILGAGSVDKYTLCFIDKESIYVLNAQVYLNNWSFKFKLNHKLNQISAYEDMVSQYLRETVTYTRDLNSLAVRSLQRASMLFYIFDNKLSSACHTDDDIIVGPYSSYLVKSNKLYKYCKVEDDGDYEVIDAANGRFTFDNFIYIGSDLEPDVGGSTMRDTEILFEGKIAIYDGNYDMVESSSDVPKDTEDLPVRTNQNNPDNQWYLYSKTLRYPMSYTDWIKISMMPTTKIFNISLVADPTKVDQKSKSKGGKK